MKRVRLVVILVVVVLIVMVIIGILSAIAVPRYANFVAAQRADSAARRIVADLGYVQRLARTTSQSKTVSFSTLADMYSVLGVDDPDHAGTPYQVHLGEEPHKATIDSVNFGGDNKLVFDGYGVAEDGTVVISVGRYERTLTVGAGGGTIPDIPIQKVIN